VTLISEEIKSLALAVLELCLFEGISKYTVSKQVSQSEKSAKTKFLKFYNYLVEGFRIDLKTFSGLAMPITNTPKLSESKYQASFGVIP